MRYRKAAPLLIFSLSFAFDTDMSRNALMPNSTMVMIDFMNKWADHHICPKCENILLSHHGTRKCPNCGSEIKETKTVRQYLKDGDYK